MVETLNGKFQASTNYESSLREWLGCITQPSHVPSSDSISCAGRKKHVSRYLPSSHVHVHKTSSRLVAK